MGANRVGRRGPTTQLSVLLLLLGSMSCGDSDDPRRPLTAGTRTESPPELPEPVALRAPSTVSVAEIPRWLGYEVLAEDVFQTARRSLDVRLSGPVDEAVLEAVAYRLRDSDSRSFARTFIVYYLPGMNVGEGGWATSHFDPDLTVRILGLRIEAQSRLSEIRDQYGESLVGAWENNQVGFASTFVLHETGGTAALEQIFPDGSARTIPLREESAPVGRRFRDPGNRFGEYWLVRGGNLELRDSEGVVFLARPISE